MDETCGDAEGKAGGGGGGVEEDMEVGECSEEEEEEEETEDIDMGSSPITDPASVIMSMTSPTGENSSTGMFCTTKILSLYNCRIYWTAFGPIAFFTYILLTS